MKRFLGGALLALIVHIATGQVSYPPGFIPYYSDCATRTLGYRTLCHDGTSVYSGGLLVGLAREKLNGSVMLLEFAAQDGGADIEYLFSDRGRGAVGASSSTGLNTGTRQILPAAGFIKNAYCRTGTNAHAGATFTESMLLNDVTVVFRAVFTDSSALTMQDTATSTPFAQNDAVTLLHDDDSLTNGTQVLFCVAEAVY